MGEQPQFNKDSLLEQIIESAQEGIIVYDRELNYQVWNPFMERVTGVSKENALGHHPSELFPFLHETGLIERLENILADGHTSVTEFPYRIPEHNKQGWASDTCSPLRDSAGNITGLISLIRDITQRKEIEDELHQSKTELNSILRSAPIGIGQVKDRQIQYVNSEFAKMLGYTEEELIGENSQIVYPSVEEYERVGQYKYEEIQKKGIGSIETTLIRKDRTLINVFLSSTPVDQNDLEQGITFSALDITKRLITEAALRESEEKYRGLYNAAPLPYQSLDENGCLLDINPQWRKTLGYHKGEVIGRWFGDFLHEDWRDPFIKNFAEFKRRGSVQGVQFKMLHKDGHTIDVEFDGYIGYTPEGQFKQTYCAFQDISDRIQAEDKLRKSESKFRLLADNTYDWEYLINPDGEYVYLSPSCERITGYSAEELTSNPQLLYDIVHPDYLEKVHQHYADENNRKTLVFTMEFPIITKNGEERWLEHHCSPVFENHDTYVGRRGNNRDVTERKLAKDALAQSEKDLRATFDQAAVGIAQVGTDGSWLRVNQRLCDIVGYTQEELLGLTFQDITYVEDLETDLGFIQQMLDCDITSYTMKKRYIRKDREIVWINLTVGMVTDDSGKPEYFISVVEDIDEQVKSEQQLRQKSKIEAVGLLAGGMAHNFNNNLSIVLGNVELANLKARHNPEIIELLKNAKIGIMRSRDLIQQIMVYTRTGDKNIEPIQLAAIVDETQKLLRSAIPRTIDLRYQALPDTKAIVINANATRIQEALVNLCNNGVHAMDEKGTLTITLDTVALQEADIPIQYEECVPGDFAVISVQDTGHGMTTSVKEKIFDPFFTTKEVNEGTGMGLSTVQGMLKDLGGIIKVDSVLGQGTTFQLYFPVIAEQIVKSSATNQVLPRGAEHILFVEDDEILASLGEKMLTEMGYQVTTMTESVEALKLFTVNADQIDLVITDQTMPDLCGKDLIQKLLKIKPDLPTIICTGFSTKIDNEVAAALGIKAFMLKPLVLPELMQTVRRVLDEAAK